MATKKRFTSTSGFKTHLTERHFFPDPSWAAEDGLVAMGDELNNQILLEAYSFGIFPWPHDEMPLLWFSPDPRGILRFSELHTPRSLCKALKRAQFQVRFNTEFQAVVEECSKAPRPGQFGTWITEPMKRAYYEFHRAGYAHSIECWQDEKLVGGMYGVYVGGVFSGESMFYKVSHASKFCLLSLIDLLKKNNNTWMDIQMLTPVTQQMGGEYVSRDEYLDLLEQSQQQARPLMF